MPKLSQEQIDQAREVDLLAYLLSHESGVLKQEGANYRHNEHCESLSYKLCAVFRLCRRHGFCGKAAPKVLALKNEMPVQVTPYMLNAPTEAPGSDYAEEVEPEEDDTDFEAWGFREKEE